MGQNNLRSQETVIESNYRALTVSLGSDYPLCRTTAKILMTQNKSQCLIV